MCFTQGIIFMYNTYIKVSTEFIKPHAFGSQFVNSVETIPRYRYMYITTLYHEMHAEYSVQANLCA